METAPPDRSRAWILAGRLWIVGLLGLVAVLTLNGVNVILVAVVVATVGMTAGLLLDPRRPWWGPEPAEILKDPVRKAAYRRSEIPFLVVAFIAVCIVLPMALVFAGVIE